MLTSHEPACASTHPAQISRNFFMSLAFLMSFVCVRSTALAGPPTGFTFAACGDLVQTTGFPPCLVFVIDSGERMVLTNNGSFQAGDRVYVAGDFDPNTAFNCDFSVTPILINPIIEPCFSACGTVLQNDGECHRLMAGDGEVLALTHPTGFPEGTEVFVNGLVAADPVLCPSGPHRLIEQPESGLCGGGFGRLLIRFGCTVFVDRSGAEFELTTTGDFDIGAFVEVAGFLDTENPGACGRPMIRQNTIRTAFGGAGTVVLDSNCGLLFEADLGGFGPTYRVNGIENFVPGDRVFVTGALNPDCIDVPECAIACLRESTIAPLYTHCGGLAIGENGCALFDTLDGQPPRLVENDGGQFPGAYVFVAGAVQDESIICGDTHYETIVDNVLLPCFQGCGELMMGFECAPLFASDDGGIFWLENTRNFHTGDRVYVEGGVGNVCFAMCPFGCIQANTISYCPGTGDVNLDGFVDPDDIPYFVAVILGDDTTIAHVRAADVDGSGVVDGADIPNFTLYTLGI
jgi:hypothetical protein